MEIIALSGYARSGKDAAAQILVGEFGFKKVAFADKLRDMLYALDPICGLDWSDYHSRIPKIINVQTVIDDYGWDGYKETEFGPEIRRLLQRLGTEAGRQVLWDSIWIDAALTGLPADSKIVISDARFLNEFYAIHEHNGYIWRIEREGVGPTNDHPSETEAADFNKFSLYLNNNGTLEEFQELVRNEYTLGRYKEWCY